VIDNATDEDILHEYHKCNMCGAEPIWGIRFKCAQCEDVDLCEVCFDSRLKRLNLKQEYLSLASEEDVRETS
jgi:mRNA (2'-O-methyladenosine-N6-)-methyltransferase